MRNRCVLRHSGHFLTVMALWLGLLLGGCAAESQKESPDQLSPEIQKTLGLIEQIELGIARGEIFNATSLRQKQAFEGSLKSLKVSLYKLGEDPENETYRSDIKKKQRIFSETPIYSYDQQLVSALLLTLENIIDYVVFYADFGEDFAGFQSVPMKGNAYWQPHEWGFAKITAYKKGAVRQLLVSPLLDLSGLEQPRLEFSQAVAFLKDWAQLRVLVGRKFSGHVGDAVFQELPVPNRPPYEPYWEWHASGDIDLSAYQNEPVIIAFEYTSAAGNEPTWEIDYVKIKGKGALEQQSWQLLDQPEDDSKKNKVPEDKEKDTKPTTDGAEKSTEKEKEPASKDKDTADSKTDTKESDENKKETDGADDTDKKLESLWAEDFAKGIAAFYQVNQAGKATWYGGKYRNEFYARISAYNKGANKNWLITPQFDLSGVTHPSLQVTQKYGYLTTDSVNMKILASADYKGGDPLAATWKVLKISPLPKYPEDKKSDYTPWQTSDPFLLDEFSSGAVSIAFYYENDVTEPLWDISSVKILGIGTLTFKVWGKEEVHP